MNDSLYEIFINHQNWYYYKEEPSDDDWIIIEKEMKQAADEYVRSLLSLPNEIRINVIEEDVSGVYGKEPPFTHFNSIRQKYYKLVVRNFLSIVSEQLNRYFRKMIWELQPKTLYLLDMEEGKWSIEEELSQEDAFRLYNSFKRQGLQVISFRELCSNLYTVIGTPRPTGTKGEEQNENHIQEASQRHNKAMGDIELLRIFQGDSAQLEAYLKYIGNARFDSRKASRAAELAKNGIIMEEDINGRLYTALKSHGLVKCTESTWRGKTIPKRKKK